jgi:hypothetical protein
VILGINALLEVEETTRKEGNNNVSVNRKKMEFYGTAVSNDGQQRSGVISGKSHTVI